MKWYNFETMFRTLCDELRHHLKQAGIYYELSGGAGFWHFEIKATADQADDINRFLDSVSIREV